MAEMAPIEIPPLVIHDPGFARGMQMGREYYFELDCGKTFTDAEIVDMMKDALSIAKFKRAVQLAKINGLSRPSYAWDVGFVVGWLCGLFTTMTLSLCTTLDAVLRVAL
jgi:hypothetical protein